MTEILKSETALAVIEKIRWAQPDRIATLWNWGFGFANREMHRWHAGTLHAYWLATKDEITSVEPGFQTFREQIQSLDIVQEVQVEMYRLDDGWIGEELLGERWSIHFSQPVEYTHR